jgi:hypothetical protein
MERIVFNLIITILKLEAGTWLQKNLNHIAVEEEEEEEDEEDDDDDDDDDDCVILRINGDYFPIFKLKC